MGWWQITLGVGWSKTAESLWRNSVWQWRDDGDGEGVDGGGDGSKYLIIGMAEHILKG